MEMKRRIEELENSLVVVELNIKSILHELPKLTKKIDSISQNKFRLCLGNLQHFKNEYNSIQVQINTLTVYESRH